jgi:hypothetical protein
MMPVREKIRPDSKQGTQEKVRVQFEFTPDALARLEAIKLATDAPTKAEVVRNALRLYEWFVNEAEADNTIISMDKNGQATSQFKARLLLG